MSDVNLAQFRRVKRRALRVRGLALHKCKAGSRSVHELGEFYLVDPYTNSIAAKHIDLDELEDELSEQTPEEIQFRRVQRLIRETKGQKLHRATARWRLTMGDYYLTGPNLEFTAKVNLDQLEKELAN